MGRVHGPGLLDRAGVLAALFFGLGVGVSIAFKSPAVGLGLFFALGGPWIFFWLYHAACPRASSCAVGARRVAFCLFMPHL